MFTVYVSLQGGVISNAAKHLGKERPYALAPLAPLALEQHDIARVL